MIDTHSHINFEEYMENFDLLLDEMKQEEIGVLIVQML